MQGKLCFDMISKRFGWSSGRWALPFVLDEWKPILEPFSPVHYPLVLCWLCRLWDQNIPMHRMESYCWPSVAWIWVASRTGSFPPLQPMSTSRSLPPGHFPRRLQRRPASPFACGAGTLGHDIPGRSRPPWSWRPPARSDGGHGRRFFGNTRKCRAEVMLEIFR